MTERAPMTAEWLRYLKQETDRRAAEIAQKLLQVPDYPPLPECPSCQAAPERITSRAESLAFGQDATPVLVDFSPCGHGFVIPEAELLRG
ncbi:hypothetical protein [Streptomyces sp. NPDC006527]|uniref:hypothetical protein n=1 Tax=Streptomyces sp. NPDC006527 TaxID=3364749 RepID=UPI0036C5068F